MSTYYCLVAGLPELHFDDSKIPFTVASFKEECYDALSQADKAVFDLFFYRYDNSNLLALLKDKDAEINPLGVFTRTELEEQIRAVKEDDATVTKILPYAREFVTAYLAEQPLFDGMLWEDQLASLYFNYACAHSEGLVARWYELNLNVNNLLVALAGRKHGIDTSAAIVGNNEVATALRTSRARDFGLSGTADYIDAIQRLAEEDELYDREHKIDQFKWQWIEENTFFSYFTIEKLFAYLLQVEMLERWSVANAQQGESDFRALLEQLKKEVEVPQEFTV